MFVSSECLSASHPLPYRDNRSGGRSMSGSGSTLTLDQDDRSRAGTLLIILEIVNRHGRSSASLPDGKVLVGSSRQPFLDAARVLIAAGYDPASWVEGWRSG